MTLSQRIVNTACKAEILIQRQNHDMRVIIANGCYRTVCAVVVNNDR